MNFPPEMIRALREAKRIAVLTGAGVSAESGIPTFREAQTGLWARYRPEDLATPEAFRRNPKLVWDWYAWRRQMVKNVQPNPGHEALARLETHCRGNEGRFTLITQNVDGLHQRAGSQNVIELHGSIQRVKCFDENTPVDSWDNSETPPHCPYCGSFLRPDVVWYGEGLPMDALNRAYLAAAESDIFFSIGTSSLVQPAASLPVLALEAQAILIEINPQHTPLSASASYVLEGPSGQVLPQLVERIVL